MARKLGLDGTAVAYAALSDLLCESSTEILWENQDSNGIAAHLLEAADVEFQPRTRKLILTFDLSGEAPPPAPAPAPYVDDEPVPYVPAEPAD